MKKLYNTKIFKAIFFSVLTIFFAEKSFADYTVAAGQTIDASTITGQSGVLTVNGTLNVLGNGTVSLLGFTSVVINCPGQIYWQQNGNLVFSAGTSVDVTGWTTGATCGLQPMGGTASASLVIGSITIAVSNDNSNNAAYSFRQFNNAGGLANFTLTGPSSPICYTSNFTVTLTPTDNAINFDCDWSVNQSGGISPASVSGFTGAINATVTPTNSNTAKTYTITCTIKRHNDTDPIAIKTFNVTVNPTPSVSTQTATTCSGTGFSVTPANGGSNVIPSGTTYSWSAPTVTGGMTGGASGLNASSITGTLVNSTNTNQTATYNITPASGTCSGSPFTLTVTVTPTPSIVAQTATTCSGTGFSVAPADGSGNIVPAGTTYSWLAPTVTGGMTGGAVGNNVSSITGTLTNTTNTPQTATYTVTPKSGSCTGSAFTVTVTVNPKPVGSASSQTICSGSSSSVTLNSTLSGTTYTWTGAIQTTPAGGTITGFSNCSSSCGSTIAQTLTNTGTTAGIIRYTVTPTANSCPGATFTVDVTVKPTPVGSASSQTICSGSASSVALNSTVSGTTYTWTAALQTTPTGGTITGFSNCNSSCGSTIVQTLTNTGTTAGIIRYTVTPTANSCSGATFTVDVTVNPKPVGSASPQTICSGSTSSVVLNSTVSGTAYTWTAAIQTTPAGGTITGFSNCSSSCGSTIAQTLTNTGTTTGVIRYMVTPTANSCAGAAFTVDITVNPIPSASSISISNSCFGSTASIDVTATGATSYQWQLSTDGGISWSDLSNASPYSGVTGASLNISSTTINLLSYSFRVQMSNSACNASASNSIPFQFLNQWLGANDQNWENPANWSYGQTPSSSSCNTVIIPSGTINSPKLTADAVLPNLIIANGANLDLNGKTLTLNGTFNGPGTTGTLSGSATSGLIVNGDAGTIGFNPSSPYNQLKTLTVNTNGNLSLGGNAAAGDTVNIVAGNSSGYGTVTVDGNLNANGVLTLKSDANGTARVGYSAGSITGNVTVERYIPPMRAWRFLTAPINASNQTVWDAWQEGANNFGIDYNTFNKNPHPGYGTHITGNNNSNLGYDFNTTQNASYKVWNVTGTGWNPAEPPTKTTKVTDNSAYCIFVRGSRAVNLSLGTGAPPDATVLRTSGTLNQTGLTATKTYKVNTPGKVAFVGNPYASAIDLHSLLQQRSSGIDTTKFWVWDPKIVGAGTDNVGAYVSYSNGMVVPSSSPTYPDVASIFRVQSGQAFMVQLSPGNTTATLNFQESDKIAQQANVFGLMAAKQSASASYPVIYTNLLVRKGEQTSLIDGVGSGFDKRFSSAFDKDDAGKLWNFDENISLVRNGKPLAIEMRQPVTGTDTLFYDLILKQKRYALKIFAANLAADASPKAWLIDKYLNKKIVVNLLDTTIYKFEPNSDSNSYHDRFILIFKNVKENIAGSGNNAANMALVKAESNVVLYPNPVSNGKATLQFAHMDKGNYAVTLYSPLGQKLATRNLQHNGGSNNYVLPLEASWTAGVYRISVINENSKKSINLNLVISR